MQTPRLQLNELDRAYFAQVQEAARISQQQTKAKVIAALIESYRTIAADAKQITDLRRRAEIAESALVKILENPCTKVTGDIARIALANKE